MFIEKQLGKEARLRQEPRKHEGADQTASEKEAYIKMQFISDEDATRNALCFTTISQKIDLFGQPPVRTSLAFPINTMPLRGKGSPLND